ncbi:MAG: hypothetical protein OEV77_05550, partial [Nitrospira sp.]|nr:hypothetical protein [Nitrospira sp.]
MVGIIALRDGYEGAGGSTMGTSPIMKEWKLEAIEFTEYDSPDFMKGSIRCHLYLVGLEGFLNAYFSATYFAEFSINGNTVLSLMFIKSSSLNIETLFFTDIRDTS